jgi:diaminohydroxyphosphoribosylaminopyrimidine deaminase/5-amino-6-(5-phosphoribosylamino)uracil reductase
MPPGVRLELRTGALADELAALAEEGVQSLLLEGGPTLGESFLREDLVDKVMLFVAPTIGRNGPVFAPELLAPVPLRRFTAEQVGDDLLLGGYVHEP